MKCYLLLEHLQLVIEISIIRNSSTVNKTKASNLYIHSHIYLKLSQRFISSLYSVKHKIYNLQLSKTINNMPILKVYSIPPTPKHFQSKLTHIKARCTISRQSTVLRYHYHQKSHTRNEDTLFRFFQQKNMKKSQSYMFIRSFCSPIDHLFFTNLHDFARRLFRSISSLTRR